MTTDRRDYKRAWHKVNHPRKPWPREVVAHATEEYSISLRKAGLEGGVDYLATPKPGGAILLTPVPK